MVYWVDDHFEMAYLETNIESENDLGFDIHHAKDGFVMFTKWLDKTRKSLLPPYATHGIGVGGLVLHPDENHVLMIQEKFRP